MGSTGEFKPLAETVMFKGLQLGALKLSHRVVLSPLTRMRGTKVADGVFEPTELNAEYYGQRASKGGFLVTEACPISRMVSEGQFHILESTY
jgi:2,4-dienoyl-CoA reductase-like NADH-dependent reductase (Old Yellow Enzyme family)